MKNLGTLLLGIWLVLTGLVSLTDVHFNGLGLVLGFIALAAGILLFIQLGRSRLRSRLDQLLLSLWLILQGLAALLSLTFKGFDLVLGLLALITGILYLIDRGSFRKRANLGWLLLAFWLILTGLIGLVSFQFNGIGIIMGILAFIAGALIALGR